MPLSQPQISLFIVLTIIFSLCICLVMAFYIRYRRIAQYQPLINNSRLDIKIPIELKITDAVNGIVKLELRNLTRAQIENNHIDFELNLTLPHDKSQSVIAFDEYKLYLKMNLSSPAIFVRFALNLNDYNIKCKLRHKLASKHKWSQYSLAHIINIPSLISSSFAVHDMVDFREANDFYLKQGIIVQKLENNYFAIAEKGKIRQINESGNSIKDIVIVIHKNRILGQKVYLRCMIDTDRYMKNNGLSNFLLLRSTDSVLNARFKALTNIYTEYSIKYVSDIEEGYNMYYIGKYLAKHIMEYLYFEENNNRFLFNCLVNSKDGIMSMYESREYIINSRIASLRNNAIDKTSLSSVDSLSERCDICNCGISSFDWLLQCPQSVCDYHIICSKCGNNVVIQYMQLMEVLKHILSAYLNDDCIHEVVSFTVAPIVEL